MTETAHAQAETAGAVVDRFNAAWDAHDLDAALAVYEESEVLNILDGVDQVDKVLFLATTNYPERLSARILDRRKTNARS